MTTRTLRITLSAVALVFAVLDLALPAVFQEEDK